MRTNKIKRRSLTSIQTCDVWELPPIEDNTEEVEKVLKEMGVTTDEVEKKLPLKKRKKNDS